MRKIVAYIVVVPIVLLIFFDLLFSDFGPGETQQSRLITILVFLLIAGLIVYLIKKKL